MGADNHSTVQPPTKKEQAQKKSNVALEILRSLDEDWEFMKDSDKRRSMRRAMEVLEND